MGLQKYRADYAGEKQSNGATPWFARWVGGPTLALIRDCPIENGTISPRTVYVRGEPATWFFIPAACQYQGKTITGHITADAHGEYVFRVHTADIPKIAEATS